MARSETSLRLFLAFASLVAIFGGATWATVTGLADVSDSLRQINHHERGVRAALALASAVRDQYAHQAHTIILGNDSHLAFYDRARRRVVALQDEVRTYADAPEERGAVEEMARAAGDLDRAFRESLVPAVLRDDKSVIQREHARILGLVSSIQESADGLAGHFERSIDALELRADGIRQRTFRWATALFVFATLFAAAVGLYIGRSVAGPIQALADGASHLARGDLDTRIVIAAPAEFADLARQWNAMTTSLKEHQARLLQTERLAGIGQLAAGVAHEINNPLGVILGYTRVLLRKAEGSLAEDLGVIEDESLRCQEIVEGLLDLSRPLQLKPTPVELRELCEEVVGRLRESQKLPSAAVAIQGTAQVEADARRIRQVVMNLIQNAIEAAGREGHVEVRIEAGERAALTVSDDGPGVREEDQGRLFEPFFTTKPSGTGLGLAVSEAIARAHGGTIEVDRAVRGSGARFTLRLPLHARPAA